MRSSVSSAGLKRKLSQMGMLRPRQGDPLEAGASSLDDKAACWRGRHHTSGRLPGGPKSALARNLATSVTTVRA